MNKRSSIKKEVGERFILVNEKKLQFKEEKKIISNSYYTTNGEKLLVIKNVENSIIELDNTNTENIIIKSLTNVIIKPKEGKIDEEWDEIVLAKGACVELFLVENNFYILSSDGLKLD